MTVLGLKKYRVTLQNFLFGYEWGPRDYEVEAGCEDSAIKLALIAANDPFSDPTACEVIQ